MKKILYSKLPLIISIVTLVVVTCFLRYNLYLNSVQLAKEFKNQNVRELYSIDLLKISSRLNSFSRALNWVCIQGQSNSVQFFNMEKGACSTGIFQQKVDIKIPEASNLVISFTLKLSQDLQLLFSFFFLLQTMLIISLLYASKIAEEEKVEQELELNKLSKKMFHDIRSPLAALSAISETAKFKTSEEENIFNNAISRINDIANSLLSKNHKELIQLPSFADIDLLIFNIIEEKRIEYSKKPLSITYQRKHNLNALIVDDEFKRILSNLINNSIEACKNIPNIELTASHIKQDIILTIKDNGSGIPAHILNRLGTDSITTKKSGNGIGFKEACESVIEWGGSLKILESTSSGTTIEVTLKAKEDIVAEIQKYVLIDDDDLVRMTWEMKAKKSGINLQTFSTPQLFNEVKNQMNKNNFLFIDSELGSVKGEDVAKELFADGFTNINLTTGHPPEKFKELTFLKSIISKKTPF